MTTKSSKKQDDKKTTSKKVYRNGSSSRVKTNGVTKDIMINPAINPLTPLFNASTNQAYRLLDLLLEHGWSIDDNACTKKALHISKDDENFVLYFFFGDRCSDAWLADEDKFGDEDPLWFSDRSHIVSPLFEMKEYIDSICFELQSAIIVFMPPNYVINKNVMSVSSDWDDYRMVSFKRLCNIIKSDVKLSYVKTNLDDIGTCYKANRKYQIQEESETTLVDLAKMHASDINVEGFVVCRLEEGDTENDLEKIVSRGSKSCYNIEGLRGVMVGSAFRNRSEHTLPYQFTLTITNDLNQMVYTDKAEGEFDSNGEFTFTSYAKDVVCVKGNYTARIEFYDKSLVQTDFVVGDRDITTSFKIENMRLHPKNETIANDNKKEPMAELDSLIGLSDLKDQLKRSIAKMQMDQLRQEQNMPIKAQQLHMAFLGNPGTGKTTMAKLLGQIYKEIGVLSKGHVVVEDRSTLMTQSWGGEGELVNKALEKAQGGILFIDEAYDLVTEHKSDPGKLIISALLTAMADESNRDIIIVFAGYTLPMERLLSKNYGLRSRLKPMYFKDYNVGELIQIADLWLNKNCYEMTSDARRYFQAVVTTAYASRNEYFGNARYVINLLENEIQPSMAERVISQDTFMLPVDKLSTIEACDIPNYNTEKGSINDALARLNNMIGLGSLKQELRKHLSLMRFIQARRDNKIDTLVPPLHMIFTGNPGTGKTSVTEYLGDIYHAMGILSVGNVIKVTRADMIDSAVGGTEEKMKELINAAHGNILFIDEAYTLFAAEGKDFGKNAMEVLLDALGKEVCDMIVILAGYPKEMEDLLNMNPGIKGRFPYLFHFPDYNEAELFEIAESVIANHNLTLTRGASEAIKAIISRECKIKDSNFSNARFIVRLITTQVLPNMAMRLEGETDPDRLKRIHQIDIPIEPKQIKMITENLFDEEVIDSALMRLDNMVGLTNVKQAIHQFVDFARALNIKDPAQIKDMPLKWHFVGNVGTGKSSVAKILSEILKAMNLLGKGHTVELKVEEIYGVADYKACEYVKQKMKESSQGLLFVDGDMSHFGTSTATLNPSYIHTCLTASAKETSEHFALVIAEKFSANIGLAKQLSKIGINNFDHTLIFDDYTTEELMKVLSLQLEKYDLSLSSEATTIMHKYIEKLCSDNITYANVRTIKKLTHVIFSIAANSEVKENVVSAESVAKFVMTQPAHRKIGYRY